MRAPLEQLIAAALSQLDIAGDPFPAGEPTISRTRDPRHGDFTTNVAMRLAKQLGRPPRQLAQDIMDRLPASDLVSDTQLAGPGFINFTLAPAAYHDLLRQIIGDGDQFGRSNLGAGSRVLVEYVSANPTGPLHVGHGRLAAYGASLSNLLRATGHQVSEEYYVNDAGRQMNILAASLWIRYAQALGGDLGLPEKAYQGSYVTEMVAPLTAQYGDRFLFDTADLSHRLQRETNTERQLDTLIDTLQNTLGGEGFGVFVEGALQPVMDDIKNDLAQFGVTPDRWFSERSLVSEGVLHRALDELRQRDQLYEKDGATWFKATDFGDEKDRVVVRENGATTYFASDIAYHYGKRQRGFDLLLDVLGADHHGYVARVRAGLEALDEPGDSLEVRLIQFVALFRGGEKVAMGTRSGEFVTLRELREEVGNDAARFFYVMRSNDQHLDFDLELAASKSDENPVYYIQYAHARVASILRKLGEAGASPPERPEAVDLTRLEQPRERALLVALSRFPEIVELAAVNRAPQHVVHFLRDLAADFHTYYNAHKVVVDDGALRDARVCLCLGAQQVIRNGLALLGVSAPEQM